jgi:hypothetical protein
MVVYFSLITSDTSYYLYITEITETKQNVRDDIEKHEQRRSIIYENSACKEAYAHGLAAPLTAPLPLLIGAVACPKTVGLCDPVGLTLNAGECCNGRPVSAPVGEAAST